MIFYTDEQFRIISIDKEPEKYAYSHEVYEKYEESSFYIMCNTCIRLFKHEPSFLTELNEDGTEKKDEFRRPIYALDDSGNKIITGWGIFPYVDYDVIMSIQAEHDAQEKKKTELQLALVEQYEVNLALQEEVTNTQIAIAEFYEAGGVV